MKLPKIVTFLLVYVGLLTCFVFYNISLHLQNPDDMISLVSTLMMILGIAITQQVWSEIGKNGCMKVLAAATLSGILAAIPMLLVSSFSNSVAQAIDPATMRSIRNLPGAIVPGVIIWTVFMYAKIAVLAGWQFLAPHAIAFWHRIKRH